MMATYFNGGSEIQTAGDNLQTLYLMNPNYSDNNHPNNQQQTLHTNMLLPNVLINHAPHHHPHHHHQQQLIGIPLSTSHNSDNLNRLSSSSLSLHGADNHHGSALSSRVHHYNLWNPTMDPSPTQPSPIPTPTGPAGPQGLSLSLSHQHQSTGSNGMQGGAGVGSGGAGVIIGSKFSKAAQELLDEVVNVIGELNNNKGGKNNNCGVRKEKAKGVAMEVGAGEGSNGGGGGGEGGSGSGSKRAVEHLSAAQRQELQMKKAKLLNMLDEVEQRYRQYHTQMEAVTCSLEQVAGLGCAKSYTSLALQTISKQFRSLKDAISSQIKATNKSLGEDQENNNNSKTIEGGSCLKLKMVDHHLKQQRALQQLGMMQQNAWRPQRGLPERAVSVLRAWLFEHFLHPYPKDSDKHMLAKQTGLTRSQVSNWFINARVRLWKPMVEEMYLEEVKIQEQNNSPNLEENTNTTTTTNNEFSTAPPTATLEQPVSLKPTTTNHQHKHQHHHHHLPNHNTSISMLQPSLHDSTNNMISTFSTTTTTTTSQPSFNIIGTSSSMESLMGRSPKKPTPTSSDLHKAPSNILTMDMEVKSPDHHKEQQRQHSIMMNDMPPGFNPYLVHDMGKFNPNSLPTQPHYHGNGVSLTLGLPHCEGLSLSGNHQQNFLPNQSMQLGRRIDIGAGEDPEFCGISMAQPSHPTSGYGTIDLQSRTGFAAQLLHDFVA